MSSYAVSEIEVLTASEGNEVLLVANGALSQAANQVCWPAQAAMEAKLAAAFAAEGVKLRRAHSVDEQLEHGFIYKQRMGMDIFATIPPDAPIVIAEAVWQFSQNLLAGLQNHRGPILTVSNWSGQWSGLIGMLNLNGCLYKAGIKFSTLWSENFDDEFFRSGIHQWLRERRIQHDSSHVRPLDLAQLPRAEVELGVSLAKSLKFYKAIMGIFDEGCMGMYNAIIEDPLLNSTGVYKERLSQSTLIAAMREISDGEARQVRQWLDESGITFKTGANEKTDLTDRQILEQCRMYIAAVRIADEFGCDAIGIQYQPGLKDIAPASDLIEGLLNNVERPPVFDKNGRELYPGQSLPHFNEVDECAGLDAIITNRIWNTMHLDPATTLHDVRWGEHYKDDDIDDFIWLLQISGASPASHFTNGYKSAISERQPPMFFPLGGGTLKGICKPGHIIWSRVFVEDGALHVDLGKAKAVELPREETERRWQLVAPQWPIMHIMLQGISRNQFMARHRANHLNVAYVPSTEISEKVLAVKAAMMAALGIHVNLCGD